MTGQRKTDGLWIKTTYTVLSICGALISFIYITDRIESKDFRNQIIKIQSGQSSTLNHWVNEVKISNLKFRQAEKKIDELTVQNSTLTRTVDGLAYQVKDLCVAFKQYAADKGYINHGCRR